MTDKDIPIQVTITGWSPFIPTEEDNSSLPVGALEYTFVNKGKTNTDAIFSFNAKNFLIEDDKDNRIAALANGFALQGNDSSFADLYR